MTTANFKPLLWHALWNADLISVPEVSLKCGRTILERSDLERRHLAVQIGEDAWQKMLAEWNRADADQMAALQLGTGAVLAEFFTAPVTLSGEDRATAAHLGTLANLLVGVYDDLMDDGAGLERDLLPRGLLSAAGDFGKGDQTPLAPLVNAYFQQMAALPGLEARPEIARTLRRAIVKMYDAERMTLAGSDAHGRMRGWRRKSTLPFVVMGLPAWLMTADFDARAYRRHLRWLCRCGEFWGWIDDALDMDQDARTGHPNRVYEALQACSETPECLASRIAKQGQDIIIEWCQTTPHALRLPLAVQEAIPTCLFSAFGGLPLSLLRREVTTHHE